MPPDASLETRKRGRIRTEKFCFAWKKRKEGILVQFPWVSVTYRTHAGYKILTCQAILLHGSLIYFILINDQCENRLMNQTVLTSASSEGAKQPAQTLMISDNFQSGFKPLWVRALKSASKVMVDVLGIWRRFNVSTSMGWRTWGLPSHSLHVSCPLGYFDEHKAHWWGY